MVHVIALDVGTSSMRALIYDERGTLLHTSGCEYHTVFPQPSWNERGGLMSFTLSVGGNTSTALFALSVVGNISIT